MGEKGENYVAMVSDSVEDGELAEDYPYGTFAWSYGRYIRCEHAG